MRPTVSKKYLEATQLLFSCVLDIEERVINTDTGLIEDEELLLQIYQPIYDWLCAIFSKYSKYLYFPYPDLKKHIIMLPFPSETRLTFDANCNKGIPAIIIVRNIAFDHAKHEKEANEDKNDEIDNIVNDEIIEKVWSELPFDIIQNHWAAIITHSNNIIMTLSSDQKPIPTESIENAFRESHVIPGSIKIGVSSVAAGLQTNHIPGGGPGGLPVEPDDNSSIGDIQFKWDIKGDKNGKNVSIAVLDTAYEFWLSQLDSNRNYIPRRENVWLNNYTFPGCQGQTVLDEYPIPMPDHGLFVCSLAKASAPEATIRLYQVLDDYGVGSGESICMAFHKLAWDIRSSSDDWVVNMSLFLAIIGSERTIIEAAKAEVDATNAQIESESIDSITDVTQMLICALKLLAKEVGNRIIFVAAAGNSQSKSYFLRHSFEALTNVTPKFHLNESISHKLIQLTASKLLVPLSLFPSCAPASYDNVVAVAATETKKAIDIAGYSLDPVDVHLKTENSKQVVDSRILGVKTFGGTVTNKNHNYLPYSNGGIVGVYLQNYPEIDQITGILKYRHNKTGLAKWSGTSFAAPLVSGAFACLLSSDEIIDDVDPALKLFQVLTKNPSAKRGNGSSDFKEPVGLPLE